MSKNVEEITVENAEILFLTVIDHNGGQSVIDIPEKTSSADNFICRMKCNDGVIIDFYAPNAQAAAQFPPEIRNADKFTEKIIDKAIKDFVKKISDSDPFVAVIKGQAYIESLVTNIIQGTFADPSALELDRMAFWQKVNLCIAAGAIHNDAGQVLKQFSSIRNKFAHQAWPNFTEENFRDFLNVLRKSKQMRKSLKLYNSTKPTMFDCITSMWFYLAEQSFRIHNNRSSLFAFWKHVTDLDNPILYDIKHFPTKHYNFKEFMEEILES